MSQNPETICRIFGFDDTTYHPPVDFWPIQRNGFALTVAAIARGDKRIVLTAPTGTGKSRLMVALIEWATTNNWDTVLYTHRRMLAAQTASVLEDHGIEFGFRMAGHDTALLKPVQLAMLQSEHSAVFRKQSRELHAAKLVLIDEIHAHGGELLEELCRRHHAAGAAIVGVTATPLDLVSEWDTLVIAGTVSDGRKCGALVPAYTYCPDEPDMALIRKYKVSENGQDLTDKQNKEVIMRPGVFGRVYDHWKRLNPDAKPTLLFGPDVGGSLFFAKEFHRKGVRSAHIDAKQIWRDGDFIDSSDENRAELLKATETGEIQVLCNRFVLREGIDLPHIAHAIFACVVGSLRSWIQMGGRPLRAHPSLSEVCIQDHGGNFRRHGSLNENRNWELGQTGYKTTGLRIEGMRDKPESEPITCPRCSMMRLSGPKCPKCGYEYHKRSKVVVQVDGNLHCVEGATYKPHRTVMKPDTAEKWIRMYHRAKSDKWDASFRQAIAYFYQEEKYWPPMNLPMMPKDRADFFEKARDVPADRLVPRS